MNVRNITTMGTYVLATVCVVLTVVVAYLVITTQHQSSRLAQQTRAIALAVHTSTQSNIRARYDDCQASNRVLAALRAGVRAGKRTDPLLFKLVPSLDTPEVHALVTAQRAERLRALANKDCREYALEAVPSSERHNYTVPVR